MSQNGHTHNNNSAAYAACETILYHRELKGGHITEDLFIEYIN